MVFKIGMQSFYTSFEMFINCCEGTQYNRNGRHKKLKSLSLILRCFCPTIDSGRRVYSITRFASRSGKNNVDVLRICIADNMGPE